MSKRSLVSLIALLSAPLLWLSAPRAASQLVEKKQTLVIGYPTTGIVVSDKQPVYKGLVYVKVYAAPGSAVPAGAAPVVSAELAPSQRTVSQLEQGEYEVHFAVRKGSELTTLIHRNVMLRADQAVSLVVEMNADAPTTVVGGDWTAQKMVQTIKELQSEVAGLKRELAEIKRK